MTTTEKVLRAERFELVDAHGIVRGAFGQISSHKYGLTLYDFQGTPRVGVGFSTEEGTGLIQLLGEQSNVSLMVDKDGGAKIALMQDGQQRMGLAFLPDKTAALSIFDQTRVQRAGIMVDTQDGKVGLILRPAALDTHRVQSSKPQRCGRRTTKKDPKKR